MNLIGVVTALATFLSVWFGHVAVRKVEFISPTLWIPKVIFTTLGLIVGVLSLFTTNRPLSAALGIFCITLLFDALELTRQQNRIIKGHAPANPKNPRHAKILAESPSASTRDLLKRDPIGYTSSAQEASQPISNL